MISALVHWPVGPVRLRWVPQPMRYSEPVTAVHCFCFSGDQLVLVDVAGRGASIPGGHVRPGERLLDCLHREVAEEACITVHSPALLGAVECDHSENPAFGPSLGYPRLASQLMYAGIVNRTLPFAGSHETARRILVPAVKCHERHHEWNAVLQAAFDDALSWKAGPQVATWIEFHDSKVAAVNHTGVDVEIVLDAYVHRWEASGDVWTGTGWTQPVRIRLSGVQNRSVVPALPVDISDGRLRVGTATHDNLVPLPFEAADAINLWLQLTAADVLEFAGRGVQIEAVGEARYVEDLPADMRPGRGWR